jgi:AraC-like DNA-binding protein
MAFELCPPDPGVSALILCYWRLDGLAPGQIYAAAPKRHIEFVVNVGAPQLAGADKLAETPFETCWLTGLREAPLYLMPTGPSLLYGVRFRDFAVPEWLSGDLRRNPRWSTDLAGASPARMLAASIAGCRDLKSASERFDAFFLAGRARIEDAEMLARAVRRCDADEMLTPAAILRRFEGTSRRARAQAQDHGGLTLRRFSRLARFDRALMRLGSDSGERMADIAVDVGYYDEAHMAHDFALLCRITPAAYRRSRRQDGAELPHHMFACD